MKLSDEMKVRLFFALNRLSKISRRCLNQYLNRFFVCGECYYLDKDLYICLNSGDTRGMRCGGKAPACENFWPKPKKTKEETKSEKNKS